MSRRICVDGVVGKKLLEGVERCVVGTVDKALERGLRADSAALSPCLYTK